MNEDIGNDQLIVDGWLDVTQNILPVNRYSEFDVLVFEDRYQIFANGDLVTTLNVEMADIYRRRGIVLECQKRWNAVGKAFMEVMPMPKLMLENLKHVVELMEHYDIDITEVLRGEE